MTIRGVVFGFEPNAVHRAGRTERSFAAAGVVLDEEPAWSPELLAARLRETSGPLLLIRAGAWLAHDESLAPIPCSATGRPLLGLGAILQPRDVVTPWNRDAMAWSRTLSRCGGDLQRRSWLTRTLPEIGCVYLEEAAAKELAIQLAAGQPIRTAISRLVRDRRLRAVHLSALDVQSDDALRVLQVVTTIQIGGAERVTLDLAEELNRPGIRVAVAALSQPTRLTFSPPPCFAEFSTVPNNPKARAEVIAREARSFGADLVHAHLIRAAEACAIKAHGLPLAMTVHNASPAWPAGLATADGCTADLLFACAQSVAADLEAHALPIPVRTVWNGIDPRPFASTPALREAAAHWRAARGWRADDFVLVTVANARPQKRLHALPEIVCELQRRTPTRTVRLVLVGALGEGTAEGQAATARLEAAITHWRIRDRVHRTGAIANVATVLAAADAFLSTSAYEGLSLAQLEALAAGLPVVATEVGGAAELAAQSHNVHLLPLEASAAAFAECLATIAAASGSCASGMPSSFTRYRMASRYASLYPRAIERARDFPTTEELWLITNNFSTGGAQSSARRLLIGLADRGVKVRAFTVQENPKRPTPGRTALLKAGVPVVAVAPSEPLDAGKAAARILTEAARHRPRAVVFWNLIASYKILLADGFLDTPIYDVSPGGMYFTSLAQYFAQPRPGLPYLTPREYGARLAGVVVKYAAESAAAAELGAPVHVIPNGILPAPPRRAIVRARCLVIGTAARLSPDKRLEDLLAGLRLAHSRLPRYVLRIAGGEDGEARAYARSLRRHARGLPVQWCGSVADTSAFLAGLDIFAMISEPAGCPNASLEAMAAGLPVVATDVGGAAEQVLDGITGHLVPRGDTAAFAEALLALAHDASRRTRLGAAARDHVHSQFSLETMIHRYQSLCLGESTGRSTEKGPQVSANYDSCHARPVRPLAAEPSPI